MLLIFGGGSGIGLAIARQMVGQGQSVVILGRDEAKLAQAAQEIGSQWRQCDARDFAQVEAAFQAYEGITAAVNCAGSILLKPAHLTSESDFVETINSNLKTAFAVVRAAGRSMKTGGSVLLFSSAAARLGLPNHEAIAAAKAGIQGLTISAAATYAGRSLRINAIAPGLTDTPLAAKILSRPESRQASEAQHPLGRVGTAEEVASLACWLLSPQASWVTGQIYGIDGGLGTIKSGR